MGTILYTYEEHLCLMIMSGGGSELIFYSCFQSKKDEVMRKRRNINVEEDEDITPGGLGPVLTIEALQSLVLVGVAY